VSNVLGEEKAVLQRTNEVTYTHHLYKSRLETICVRAGKQGRKMPLPARERDRGELNEAFHLYHFVIVTF